MEEPWIYKNILIPTDGSDAAETAAIEGIGLAKAMGAKVYGLYVNKYVGLRWSANRGRLGEHGGPA